MNLFLKYNCYVFCLLTTFVFAQNINENGRGLCFGATKCMRLSECSLLHDLIHRSCIAADRFRSLTCGYIGIEPMLCCPVGGHQSIVPSGKQTGSLLNSNEYEKEMPCGQTLLKSINGFNGLGAQPWVVRIGFKSTVNGETKYPCGGSILSNRVILTAAHCALVKTENYKLNTVVVGEWASSTDTDCNSDFCSLPVQTLGISHVVVHPGYQQDNTYRHDVALIVLNGNINFTATARPVCILEENHKFIGQHATLVGWGKLAGQQAQPSIQQSLTLPIVSMDKCRRVYGSQVPLGNDDEQHCVGGSLEGQDACAGFGGSPFIAKHSTGVFYQIGMLSFGAEQCGTAGVPSVYVNIQNYAHWIRENTPLLY